MGVREAKLVNPSQDIINTKEACDTYNLIFKSFMDGTYHVNVSDNDFKTECRITQCEITAERAKVLIERESKGKVISIKSPILNGGKKWIAKVRLDNGEIKQYNIAKTKKSID